MKRNIVKEKSFHFSVRMIHLVRELKTRKIESALCTQLLRSGTSIAANIAEADAAISKAEFSMKLSIAYKEGKETACWLKMLNETGGLTDREYLSLDQDLQEIMKIVWTIIKKVRLSNH